MACLVILGACATSTPSPPVTMTPAQIPMQGWVVVDPQTMTVVDDDALAQRLASAQVVYLGEEHDQATHHNFQAHVVGVMARDDNTVVMGLEMFNWQQQALLDDYLRDPKAEEDRLIKLWVSSWGDNWSIYAPLITLARQPNISIVGLNAPRELSRQVARVGVDALSPELAALLPPTLDDSNTAYRDVVIESFMAHHGGGHGHGGHGSSGGHGAPAIDQGAMEAMMTNFFHAQLVWDETMAHRLSQAIKRSPDARFAVIAGAMHVQYGWGIPDRVARVHPDLRTLRIVCRTLPLDVEPAMLRRQLDPAAADLFCVSQRQADAVFEARIDR